MKNFDPTLLSFLQDNQITFQYYEHRPIFTVEEWEDIKHTIPGMHTKNLFLKDKKGQYFLVCIESSKRLPINQFRKLVGVKDLSFGTPEEMKKILNLIPGSVSLFGLINTPVIARHEAIHLYLDKDIREAKKVWRHPNRNDATIMIDHDNLVWFLNIISFYPQIIEFGEELSISW